MRHAEQQRSLPMRATIDDVPRAKKLVRWVAQGLISEAQADEIEKFEANRTKDAGLNVFTRIGALAIAIGIISLVASNWDAIPPGVKLVLDLLVGAGFAGFAARQLLKSPSPTAEPSVDSVSVAWREAGIVIMLGWTAASIALISQVYQLGGHALDAALIVLVVTTPLTLYSRSRAFYVFWLLAWQATLGAECVRIVQDRLSDAELELMVALAPAVPLALAGLFSRLKRHHAALRAAGEWLAVSEWFLAASVGTLFFYESESVVFGSWAIGSVGAALCLFLVVRGNLSAREDIPSRGRLSVAIAALASWACVYVPVITGVEHAGFLNALSFCGLWLAIAWAAAALRWRRVVSLATHLVGLRLVLVYVELFADLLTTGIGLIVSGALLLVTVRIWMKQRHRIGRWLGLPPDEEKINP